MATANEYDVVLSCSSADEPAVAAIATRLRDEVRLQPFLEKWYRGQDEPWSSAIERAIEGRRIWVDLAEDDGFARLVAGIIGRVWRSSGLPS